METTEIRLSVCLIVKDEERQIEECLRSVTAVAGEIVVLDTGSTDSTRAIAESMGARVYSAPWEGDFAKARNQCLAHARGNWILFLDADEKLDSRSGPALEEITAAPTDRPVAYSLKFLNYTGEKNGGGTFVHYYVRLFPRIPGLIYEGALHEQLRYRHSENITNYYLDEVMVHHYGYAQNIVADKNKMKRNMEILQKAIEAEPDNWFHHFNLGSALYDLDRYFEALEHLNKAEYLAEQQGACTFDSSNYYHQAKIYLHSGEPDKALTYCRKAMACNDDYYDVYFIMGLAWQQKKEWEKAIDSFKRACYGDMQKRSPQSRVFYKAIGEWLAIYEVAGIYLKQYRDLEKALHYYQTISGYADQEPDIMLKIFFCNLNLERIDDAINAIIAFRNLRPHDYNYLPEMELLEHLLKREDMPYIDRFLADYTSSVKEPYAAFLLQTAQTLITKDEHTRAIQWYSNYMDHVKGTPEEASYTNLSHAYYSREQYQDAHRILSEGIAHYPESARLHNNLAAVHMAGKDFLMARNESLKALECDPGYEQAHFNLAKCEYMLDNHNEALLHFEMLIRKGQYHSESMVYCARIHCKRGEWQRSIEKLTEVITVEPACLEAYELLAQCFRNLGNTAVAEKFEKNLQRIAALAGQGAVS